MHLAHRSARQTRERECSGGGKAVRSAKRPAAVRLLNLAGEALRGAGLPLGTLTQERLLDRAARSTGLADFGDPAFRDRLRLLLDSLEHEAHLTFLGRLVVRADTLRLLENRLRIIDTLKRHPEIERGQIRRPLFILGLPRTGTTILHQLLAQDPAHRVPMTWEVHRPWPPPEAATYDHDPRIAAVEKHFSGVDRILPGFQAIHPMGARLPQECVVLTAHDFATMIYHTTYDVPRYQKWLEAADLRPVYGFHRRQLQYLQWRCPARRWVLKSPGHLWALDALLAEYPDALIVQTHRDPLRVVASLTNLVTILRGMCSDRVDPLAVARDWTVRLAAGLSGTMDARRRAGLGEERVFDLHFRDFLGNEIAMIRRIYDRFGLDLTTAAEERMRAFLSSHPREKHGLHRYSFAHTGLDSTTERLRYASYEEAFRIAREPED
jgi:hypothetical protein